MEKIIRKYRKSKGFTLVELLIVIIIIGILAGMMMLAAGSATDKAEATKIVSNMRNIKAAAVMYYADNNNWTDDITDLSTYMDNLPSGDYEITTTTTSGDTVKTKMTIASGVITKLAAMEDNSAITVTSTDVTMPIK